MEVLHRLFTLHSLLVNSRRPVPQQRILDELECSEATFKRLLKNLRDVYDLPIRHSRKQGGYYYDPSDRIDMPSLWFTQSELHALLLMRQLLERIQPGVLNEHFQVLAERVDKLLAASGQQVPQLVDKLRIIPLAHQNLNAGVFEAITRATLEEKRLHLHYCDIAGKHSEREVSPQRLVYYRDHWYLDAFCHSRNGLRTFWLAGIQQAQRLNTKAKRLSKQQIADQVETGYGIFAGKAPHTAHLRFTGIAAMRVHGAEWHPDQKQRRNDDGSVELWLPYGDSRELLMDILKYGPDVTVLGPASLKNQVIERLKASLKKYG